MREGEGQIIRCWAFKELFSSKRAGFVFILCVSSYPSMIFSILGVAQILVIHNLSLAASYHYERGAIIEPKTLPSEHVSTSRIGSLLGIIPCTVPDCVMVKIKNWSGSVPNFSLISLSCIPKRASGQKDLGASRDESELASLYFSAFLAVSFPAVLYTSSLFIGIGF